MIFLVLEEGDVKSAERYEQEPDKGVWETVCSSQGNTEEAAKSMMLDDVLEMANTDELSTSGWLRLVFYGDDHKTVTKVEIF